MKKQSFQDSSRLNIGLNDSLNNSSGDARLFRCTREVRKRNSTSLGAQLFGPGNTLSPMTKINVANVSTRDTKSPYRSERVLDSSSPNLLSQSGLSPISKRLFMTQRTPSQDDRTTKRFTTKREPKVSSDEMMRAKKWIAQCIHEKRKKNSDPQNLSFTAESTRFKPSYLKKSSTPMFSRPKYPKPSQKLYELEEEELAPQKDLTPIPSISASTQLLTSAGQDSVESFRQLLSQDMLLHKNVSYRVLSQKWSQVQLIPAPLENLKFYIQQSQDQSAIDKILQRYSKKQLWLMAAQMQRKISALLENGVVLEDTSREVGEKVEFLEHELETSRHDKDDTIHSLEGKLHSLSRKCEEMTEVMDKLKKEKEGLTRTCNELSGALGVVRNQHQNAIEKLKGQFETRFTQKLTQVYHTKESELNDLKNGQQGALQKISKGYEESIQRFRRKYNAELEDIHEQLNMKVPHDSNVQDKMSHLKGFVTDLVTRLKQKEVRCFELESEALKLKQQMNTMAGDRKALLRIIGQLKQTYRDGLFKLKKEYKKQVARGIETLTMGGLAKMKLGEDEELSIHGHVNVSMCQDDDLVLGKINALVRVLSGLEEEKSDKNIL